LVVSREGYGIGGRTLLVDGGVEIADVEAISEQRSGGLVGWRAGVLGIRVRVWVREGEEGRGGARRCHDENKRRSGNGLRTCSRCGNVCRWCPIVITLEPE